MYNIQISLTQMVKNIYIYKVMSCEKSFWDSEFIFTYRYTVTSLTARDVTKANFFTKYKIQEFKCHKKNIWRQHMVTKTTKVYLGVWSSLYLFLL